MRYKRVMAPPRLLSRWVRARGPLLLMAAAACLLFTLLTHSLVRGQQGVSPQVYGGVIYDEHGCADCHGEEGEGGVGPALAGNPKLINQTYVTDQLLNGGGGMPAFATQLSSEQLAAVATHVRSSWGNDLEPISTDYVAGREQGARAAAVVPTGSQIFAWNCMICHGVVGEGGVGPALAGNERLSNTSYIVAQIQLGGGGMPPFQPILDSDGIAAVSTYIRTAWGNDFGPVESEHVRVQWQGLATAGQAGAGGAQSQAGAAGDESQGEGTPGAEEQQNRAGAGQEQNQDGADQEQNQEGEEGTRGRSESTESNEANSAGSRLFGSLGCAGCHSTEGAGGIGPALDGNPALADAAYVVTTIRDGRKGMPAFGERLDQPELEMIASYVRTAWSNDFGPVELGDRSGLPESLRRSQVDPVLTGRLAQAGQELYAVVGCVGCHSSEGAGGIGPPLDGNPALEDPRLVVDTIFTGAEQMPPFADTLTDRQIAALASYVRTAWTNDYGPVGVEEVTEWRPATEASDTP